jgi:broad specificity phosphatase PhoE
MYYTIYNRHDKFPEGESLDDLAQRADKAIDETVWLHVEEALKSGGHEELNIVIVSHGLAISEMVAARKSLLSLLLELSVDGSLIASIEKKSRTSTKQPFVQRPRKYRMDTGSN